MTTRDDDDRDRNPSLHGLPQAAPPADPDPDPAPVMAAPPAEALDAADDEEAPRPSNPFGHLRVPMAVAATLVLGVVLALQLGDWRAPPPAAADANSPANLALTAPQARLAQIAGLLDEHRDDEARAAWLAFRRDYPAAPVPQALRARIDALP